MPVGVVDKIVEFGVTTEVGGWRCFGMFWTVRLQALTKAKQTRDVDERKGSLRPRSLRCDAAPGTSLYANTGHSTRYAPLIVVAPKGGIL